MKRIIFALLSILVPALVGCGSTDWATAPDLSALKPAGPPARAVAVWEPAVKHNGEQTPERGFGGRVYFYDQDARKPVKVKGNVVVYAFDEENRESGDNSPTRSFFFAKDDVKKLYSKSKLGHSYNFWIPWDTDGPDGKVKKISLIVRYLPDVGSSVVSSQAAVYLPGKTGQTEMMAKAEWDRVVNFEGTIQQVAYLKETNVDRNCPPTKENLIEGNDNRPRTMLTTTITVPDNLSQGLQAALATPAPLQQREAPMTVYAQGSPAPTGAPAVNAEGKKTANVRPVTTRRSQEEFNGTIMPPLQQSKILAPGEHLR